MRGFAVHQITILGEQRNLVSILPFTKFDDMVYSETSILKGGLHEYVTKKVQIEREVEVPEHELMTSKECN